MRPYSRRLAQLIEVLHEVGPIDEPDHLAGGAATLIARHERAVGDYVEILTLDHYREVLKTKPGGLPGATALAQAKARGALTASHQTYWDAARRARGDTAGTRALIEILLAHRQSYRLRTSETGRTRSRKPA